MKLFLREFFRQRTILQGYMIGKPLPDWRDIEAGIILSERARDVTRPDHFLNNARAQALEAISGLDKALLHVLGEAADTFLESDDGRHLFVPTDRFARWQDVIVDIPPLLIVAVALLRRGPGLPGPVMTRAEVDQVIENRISPQVRHSGLPSVRDPRLDYLIRQHGLDEMHMHLNGSTEADIVWLDALSDAAGFARDLQKGARDPSVRQLFQQEEPGLDQRRLRERLLVARVLRAEIAARVLGPLSGQPVEPVDVFGLWHWSNYEFSHSHRCHPIAAYFGTPRTGTRLAWEALFLMAIVERLRASPDTYLAHLFYAYLLIKHQFCRLIVQQRDQYGFDQFQKITQNQMREMTERHYLGRLRQLDYSRTGDLDLLEGRFAPKPDMAQSVAFFTAILAAFRGYHGQPMAHPTLRKLLEAAVPGPPGRQMRLSLVAHFIKRPDRRSPDGVLFGCRHSALRRSVDRAARVALRTMGRYPGLKRYLTGFDAAANELHAPPEVFASAYRRLRAGGIAHFTYHAGEDFVHLLSGIRAVYEAVTFLGLRPGNRIGHGTAVGIEPSLWRTRIGRNVVLARGDRLDDLVLARRLLLAAGQAWSLRLDDEIGRLSKEIYDQAYPPDVLHSAWELRALDALVALDLVPVDREPVDPHLRAEANRVAGARGKCSPEAFDLFRRYHGALGAGTCVRRAQALVEVSADDDLPPEGMRVLQEAVLDEIRRRQIAIETLPTSNFRISVYQSYGEHHVQRWLGLKGDVPVPVCVGSDDPGIFATNLRNEYAHLLREIAATCQAASPPRDPVAVMEQLIRTGKIWRFLPVDPEDPADRRPHLFDPAGKAIGV